jgi:hypothetical protein
MKGAEMEPEDRLIFDKWANEGNVRVQAWLRWNGDVKIVFVDTNDSAPLAAATLTAYRADDLHLALERRKS